MAGDMLLAALLDLSDPRFVLADLTALAESLIPGECQLSAERVWRGSLSGLQLTVRTAESAHPPHRHYADLAELLRKASLSAPTRERALGALWALAEAEARVHGTTPEEIHFHEVGAVDTLVDVAGAAFALERLGIETVRSTPPLVGSGTVACAHGEMPVPAPAVAELLRGRPVRMGGGCERLTPTAAAILASWAPDFEMPHEFVARAVGYGAGHRDPVEGPPNIVRVQLGETAVSATHGRVLELEVNLDDMSAEEIGHAVQRLRAAGALEVWTSPVFMKKDRPGTLVAALVRESSRARVEAEVYEWTSTLGLRWHFVERTECGRDEVQVELGGLPVRVKRRLRPAYPGASPHGERDLSPEHDDLVRAAERAGLTLREASARVVRAALEAFRSRAGNDSRDRRGSA
jgi:uncharacterized protein (TIGR00299 family) protein